jgi:hypothetical protein
MSATYVIDRPTFFAERTTSLFAMLYMVLVQLIPCATCRPFANIHTHLAYPTQLSKLYITNMSENNAGAIDPAVSFMPSTSA